MSKQINHYNSDQNISFIYFVIIFAQLRPIAVQTIKPLPKLVVISSWEKHLPIHPTLNLCNAVYQSMAKTQNPKPHTKEDYTGL